MDRNNNSKNTSTFPIVKVNILYVSILILVGVLIFVGYKYFINKHSKAIASYIQNVLVLRQNGKDDKLIDIGNLPVSLYGDEYNLSFWMKIDSYTYRYGSRKYILRKGGTEIYLTPKENKLVVRINKFNDEIPQPTAACDNPAGCALNDDETPTTTAPEAFTDISLLSKDECKTCIGGTNICDNSTVDYKHNPILDLVANQDYDINNVAEGFDTDPTTTSPVVKTMNPSELLVEKEKGDYDECVLYDIPLQRWVHISVNIYSDNVDIFIDGKLNTTCNLNVVPDINKSPLDLHPEGGYDGYTSKLTYTNIKLSSREVYQLYKTGPH